MGVCTASSAKLHGPRVHHCVSHGRSRAPVRRSIGYAVPATARMHTHAQRGPTHASQRDTHHSLLRASTSAGGCTVQASWIAVGVRVHSWVVVAYMVHDVFPHGVDFGSMATESQHPRRADEYHDHVMCSRMALILGQWPRRASTPAMRMNIVVCNFGTPMHA